MEQENEDDECQLQFNDCSIDENLVIADHVSPLDTKKRKRVTDHADEINSGASFYYFYVHLSYIIVIN